MVNIWKIAPGYHAAGWDLFRRRGCIGLGWLAGRDADYQDYEDEEQVLLALEQEYGKNRNDCGSGSAKMIWEFVHDVKPDDIVVANKGYNEVVGIGIVKGEYLAPASRENPLRLDRTTHLHHVRRVAWFIRKPVELYGKNQFFLQRTLSRLAPDEWDKIKQAYFKTYPQDTELRNHLELYDELLSFQG